jgi:site-specific DNA recombinase
MGSNLLNQDIYAVYIRVSTTMQASEGDSIEMQLNLAQEYVKEHGGILPEENIFIEPAVSASKTELSKRTVLLQCLNKGEKGGFNKLIVYRRDRLARKIEDSLAIRNKLKNANIDLIFTAKGESEMDLNDPYNKLFENIRASMDEIESVQTGIRVSDTMQDKAKRGEFTGGNLPYGYVAKGNGKIEFIESEREVIKEIEELYLSGYGLSTIAKWLNGEKTAKLGIRPQGRARKIPQTKTSSDKWTKDSISGILFNPFYTGYTVYSPNGDKKYNKDKDTWIIAKGNHTAVRTQETQELIFAKRKERAKKTKAPRFYNTSFLLTGLLYCKECGKKYISRNSTRANGARYSYYVCQSRHDNITNCSSPSFKKEILEEYVIKAIKEQIESIDLMSLKSNIEKQLISVNNDKKEQLNSLNKKIEKLQKNYKAITQLLLDLDMDDEMYDMLKEQYQSDQKEILLNIKKAKTEKEYLKEQLEMDTSKQIETERLIERLKSFTDVIDSQPFQYQKTLLDELLDKIEIDKNGNVELSFSIDISTNEENEEKEVSFISFGGVGDTTPTNIINLTLPINRPISENLTNIVIETRYKALKYFPLWLKHMINDPNLKPYKLHKITNISYYVCKTILRKNNSLPSKENFEKICSALNTSLIEFIKFANIGVSDKIFFDVIDSAESLSRNLKNISASRRQ